MKHSFTALLLLAALSCTALGQEPNVPTVRIETRDTVAEVNNEKITRTSLAAECLQLHGEDELEEIINRMIIRLECERLGMTITADEINAEILRTAQSYKYTSDDWLKLIEEQRGFSPEQYRDVIWRMLALGKLAGPRISVSEAEIKTEYDKNFGAAVQVREIVLASRADADAVRAEVLQYPETFAAVAKNRSINPVSQPYGGMLHPIRRGTYNPQVEQILFALKVGEVSQVVEYPAGHFTIYLCEAHLQPQEVDVAAVKEQLIFQIRSAKLRQTADDVFAGLQKQAQVIRIFGSSNPALRQQYPGVAALVNGKIISRLELADSCIQKYGKSVSADMINRKIVEQACRQANVIISEQDIDKEIYEMAFKYLPLLENGSADTGLWLKRATEESGLAELMYRKNVIVPMLGLKRLVGPSIQVLEEEIQRAYEAHYGQKVQCLAILFNSNDHRRAQEVWQMAHRNKTEEAFSALAEQYSFDPESRLGKGVIPPIARYCGNPELEKVAFSLKPGEISTIFQIEESPVILYCVNIIEPQPVKIESVRVDLITAIYEKKMQIAVSRYFDELLKKTQWINHLTGQSQNPALERATREALNAPL